MIPTVRVEINSAPDTEILLWIKWWNRELTVKGVPQKTQETTNQVITTFNSWIDNWTKIIKKTRTTFPDKYKQKRAW